MGCDIHSIVQVKLGRQWVTITDCLFLWDEETHTYSPFDRRCYAVFGFLADVRNYSKVPPISEPRGLPPTWIINVRISVNSWESALFLGCLYPSFSNSNMMRTLKTGEPHERSSLDGSMAALTRESVTGAPQPFGSF